MAAYSIAAGETGAAVRTKLNAVIGQVDDTTKANTVTSTSAAALAVGANGATNPALQVDASANTVKTGVKITGAAEAGGATIAVISSGDNESITIAPKGTGSVVISKADINGGAIDGVTIGNTCKIIVPTSDPGVAGALWLDGATFKVSAGA